MNPARLRPHARPIAASVVNQAAPPLTPRPRHAQYTIYDDRPDSPIRGVFNDCRQAASPHASQPKFASLLRIRMSAVMCRTCDGGTMTASARLLGLTLENGWEVFERVRRPVQGSGGTFSHSYLARKGDRVGFVKAFDFSIAFEPGADTLRILGDLTASYEHERDVLEHCRGRRLSHVVVAISSGEVSVPNMSPMEARVFFLIFERAHGDVRCQMDRATASDAAWCMSALRCACLGLWQIHQEFIAHQDLKPSNLLTYSDSDFRISDLGSSSRRGHAIWHDNADFPGDHTYAPPEILYGHLHPEFVPRRMGADIYMLGNIAAFLFTGVNVTESLFARLDPQFHWHRWRSDYAAVLPYLQEAFSRVLEDLGRGVPGIVREEVLPLIRELCNPDLARRGFPKRVGMFDQYSVERYVTRITNSAWRIDLKPRARRQLR